MRKITQYPSMTSGKTGAGRHGVIYKSYRATGPHWPGGGTVWGWTAIGNDRAQRLPPQKKSCTGTKAIRHLAPPPCDRDISESDRTPTERRYGNAD